MFRPRPKRRLRTVLMVIGSLIFHGIIVGAAAIWPVPKSFEITPEVVEMDLSDKLGDPEVRELVVADTAPTPEPDQPTPMKYY